MILEKKVPDNEFIRWPGIMPVEYLYTSGLAGERFFRELKERERLVGTYCSKCRKLYLPPRFYCEVCFRPLSRWRPIPKSGVIYTYTIVETPRSDIPQGQDEALQDESSEQAPLGIEAISAGAGQVIVALISFKGVTGGLIHKIGEARQEEIKIGIPVEPVFEEKKNRKGSILDIKYFRPV